MSAGSNKPSRRWSCDWNDCRKTAGVLLLVGWGVTTAGIPSTAFAQVQLRPGQYEVTVAMDAGGQSGLPVKDETCITAKDLKDLSRMALPEEMKECSVSNLKTSPTRMTFDVTCVIEGKRYASTAEYSFAGDSFVTVINTTNEGKAMVMKTTGKRIGDCKS